MFYFFSPASEGVLKAQTLSKSQTVLAPDWTLANLTISN